MKIGVISDTHDRLETIQEALNIFKQQKIEMIVHCGDWVSPFTLEFFDQYCQKINLIVPIKSVFGNNEGDYRMINIRNTKLKNPIFFSPKIVLELKLYQQKIVVYHGHDTIILDALIKSQVYNTILTGHTHISRNEIIGKTLIINPGTTSHACLSKIIPNASVALYNSIENKAEIIQLISNFSR